MCTAVRKLFEQLHRIFQMFSCFSLLQLQSTLRRRRPFCLLSPSTSNSVMCTQHHWLPCMQRCDSFCPLDFFRSATILTSSYRQFGLYLYMLVWGRAWVQRKALSIPSHIPLLYYYLPPPNLPLWRMPFYVVYDILALYVPCTTSAIFSITSQAILIEWF